MDTDIPLTAQIAELRRRFSYDPRTGILIREVSYSPSVKVGSRAGTVKSDKRGGKPYLQVQIGQRKLMAHVIAYVLMTGEFPLRHLDHKNGDGLDNRWENLRLATHPQNMMNRGVTKTKKSGLPKGVFWHNQYKLYVAKLSGKTIKSSKSIEVAKAAYDAAAREKYGEFASG